MTADRAGVVDIDKRGGGPHNPQSMCCLVLLMGFLGPRIAYIFLWIFDTTRINAAFSSWIWPLLGIIFAPWTILLYTLAWGPLNGVSGFGWVIVAIGVLLDIATYASRAASNRYQAGQAGA
jgi:hypothetical protein